MSSHLVNLESKLPLYYTQLTDFGEDQRLEINLDDVETTKYSKNGQYAVAVVAIVLFLIEQQLNI